MSVHYHVDCHDPQAHLLAVTMALAVSAGTTELWLPNWLPGSYLIRDFARHLQQLTANCNGSPCTAEKIAKNRWRLTHGGGQLQIHYLVYGFDESVRGSYLDQYRLFFNGSSLLLAVAGQEQQPATLTLGPLPAPNWQLATTLPQDPSHAAGYRADNYLALIDHPVAAAPMQQGQFTVDGIEHQLALVGAPQFDMARLCRDLAVACAATQQLFGGPLPFSRYLFLIQVEGEAYGGLEHRDSTALLCSRRDLPQPGTAADDRHYSSFLALCTHEYIHAWNVKRLTPKTFLQPDLEQEVHTSQLWWYEGITSYYDELLLRRAGLISSERYLQMLSETLTRVYRHPGRHVQPLLESSFDAWTKLYKADENATNSQISYYTKGAMVGLALDLRLRRLRRGLSLDLVLRTLWQRHGLTLTGTDEDTVIALIAELAGDTVATELRHWLTSSDDPPLAELLAGAAVEWQLRPAHNADDKGGWSEQQPPRFSLGASYKGTSCGLELVSVINGGAAHIAGLAARDLIVALDGIKASPGRWQELQHSPQGSSVEVHFFRRDHLRQCQLKLQSPTPDSCGLRLTDQQPAFDWLNAPLST